MMKALIYLKLRVKSLKRFIKFSMVGGLGVFVNLFFLGIFTELAGLHYLGSSAIAFELALIGNFVANNVWTFRGRAHNHHFLVKLGKYNLICLLGMAIYVAILYFLTDFLKIYYIFSAFLSVLIVGIWNYFFSSKWAWPKTKI